MSGYYFKTWHTTITKDLADSEPRDQWLFVEQEDAECAATSQPNTNASKDSRLGQLGLPLSSAPCLNTSDSASYLRSLKKSRIKY
jgi:hypothetical protein